MLQVVHHLSVQSDKVSEYAESLDGDMKTGSKES